MFKGNSGIEWPDGKRFAFTIVDDTDKATLENLRPVYDFLYEHQFLTTKSVWPLDALSRPVQRGDTLENDPHREWILDLKRKGFEIALHGTSDEPSTRRRVIEGLNKFKEIIGSGPRLHANHTGQTEGIYWGEDRFDGAMRFIYKAARKYLGKGSKSYGHEENTPYFWGDLCQDTITFVRNMTFNDINTLQMDPLMPYHDPRRPYVRFWFSASGGVEVNSFCRLISEANQDRLLAEGGASIAYTHLGFGFCEKGRLNPRFVELMRRLADLPGWFVPTSTLLEYIGEKRGWMNAAEHQPSLRRMQWKWLIQKLERGADDTRRR